MAVIVTLNPLIEHYFNLETHCNTVVVNDIAFSRHDDITPVGGCAQTTLQGYGIEQNRKGHTITATSNVKILVF